MKSFEAEGYFTNAQIQVDNLLPCLPDFLKNQIRRMHNLEKIEENVGGKDKAILTKQEKRNMELDSQFKIEKINDEYIKQIKTKAHEHLYVEKKEDRLSFINSCWEI